MTATEELRRLLDERGVEYELTGWSNGAAVWWKDCGGVTWRAHDNDEDGLLSLYAYSSVTPAQAIDATLGRGECDRLRAENAKLREQNRYLMKGDLLHVLTDQEYIDQCERERLMQVSIDALDKESAELRELVKRLFACVRQGEDEYGTDWSCAGCDFCDSCNGLIQAGEAAIEMGIEVGG